jgi:spermidine/putrescine transport system ATP-binding protein
VYHDAVWWSNQWTGAIVDWNRQVTEIAGQEAPELGANDEKSKVPRRRRPWFVGRSTQAQSANESSAVLECRGLRKSYEVHDEGFVLGSSGGGVSFSVDRGEMFALVGPSGCGKTTTLRIIGGFVRPDSGQVLINGVDVTTCAPYARPTNTVFQSYALFPHLSVGSNVGFGLTMEGVRGRERAMRASEALEMVGLAGYERSRVNELSGGMQQRVALARALVKRPAVLLLDEPLGALDLKLRKQMQDELARLKAATSTTFIHVTHDQEEACAMADRIAVMKDGAIVQVDEPFALYRNPRTSFVATFLDAGTILRGTTTRQGNDVTMVGSGITIKAQARGQAPDTPLAAVIPADKIQISLARSNSGDKPTGTVARVVFSGSSFLIYVDVDRSTEIKASITVEEMASLGHLQPGARVNLDWSPNDVIIVADTDSAL